MGVELADGTGADALVGRDAVLGELHQLITETRLVTITGPGGVGKTSLALAAVGSLQDKTHVVVSELADVESEDAIRHTVAADLGVHVSGADTLATALPPGDDRPVLVLLDNCEHVLEAAADVAAQLVAAGPHVRVLATSRQALGVPSERVLPLAPLDVPASADDPDAEHAAAVVLLARRARAAGADLVLDEHTLPDVVRICRGLDGVPLALEIAAARLTLLSVTDVADRLSHRLSLLRAGRRGSPDRHRSLRAAVEWSFQLLSRPEQELFTALAVHPAGADLAGVTTAARAVGIPEDDVVDVLAGLVSKSLMTATKTASGMRYGMLETLRQYALERLDAAGRLADARDRHAHHYAEVARRVSADMLRAWDEKGLALLFEFDNIRSALTWTLAEDMTADRSFDLLAPLWYLALQYRPEEVAVLADRALARWPATSAPRWSEVAGTAATACVTLEDFVGARRRARAGVAAGSSAVGTAFAHCALAEVALCADDDPVAALGHLERADRAADAAGFHPLRCDLLGRRAVVLAEAGRRGEALASARRSFAMASEQGNVFEVAWSQHLIGLLLLGSDPDAAREWLTRALAEARAHLYMYGVSSSLRGLAVLAASEGATTQSAGMFLEAFDGFIRAGHADERWNTVAAMLPLLVASGARESAAVLLVGLARATSVVSRVHAPSVEQTRQELALELASTGLTARGEAMNPDQLLTLARRELRRLSETRTDTDTAPGASTQTAAEPPPELCRAGELWRVTFAGVTTHLPNLRGIHDLAVLLEHPGREVPVLDLASSPAGATPRTGSSAEQPHGPGDLGELVDARARAAYTVRVQEIQVELDEADAAGDAELGARLQHELDFLTAQLSAAYGLRGPRRSGDPVEKTRLAVTARVRKAISKIGEAHPALGRHLAHAVNTGRFCSYTPEQPTVWTVTR